MYIFPVLLQTIAVIQAGHGLLQLGSCKIVSANSRPSLCYHLFLCFDLLFVVSFGRRGRGRGRLSVSRKRRRKLL